MRPDPLASLDADQRLVATQLDDPVVVLAGAGSGKTRAITHRIAHAVAVGRYVPSATLAVTFTTRAAGEMRARLARLGVPGVQARTIHSAALRQAQYFWPRAYGTELPPVAGQTFALVAKAANAVLGHASTPLLRDLAQEITWAKAGNVPATEYTALAAVAGRAVAGATAEQVAAVMTNYERLKSAQGVIDFDDILLCTAALLHGHEDVAAQVRAGYRHFVVDEYQDVSAIQHALLKLWVGERTDLCVVGDPNQAIHAFAGARADYLLNFRRDWPTAHTLRLDRNYRSTPQILAMANRVGGAGSRLRSNQPAGPAPELVSFESDTDEAAGIAAWLTQRHGAGVPWHELAVLYRINAASPPLEAALAEANIPYQIKGSERYYDRAEIRQALTLIRAAAAKDPEVDPGEVIDVCLTKSGWALEAPLSQGAQRERWESLQALRDLVLSLQADGGLSTLGGIAEALSERAAWQQVPVGDAVTLATMHASKGLEWDAVALAGVREGLMPFALAESKAAIAEERRLLYVAITRARQVLRISWAKQGGRGRSRFLKPWADEVIDRSATTRKRGTLANRTCRVCGGALATPAERKLQRHMDCPSDYDEALFGRLREWRKATAEQARQPAFVVFTDATLVALAEQAPSSVAELLQVPGVGAVKADRYGEQVLQIVAGNGPEMLVGETDE